MSYDFRMFVPEPGIHLEKALDESERIESPKLFTKESKQRSQAIAHALRFKNPKLNWQPIALANLELIQIDASENGDGIQISLFPNEAGLTIPYCYEGAKAHE